MKRLFFLTLLISLPGCATFEDSYYDGYSAEWSAPASGGCQTPAVNLSPSPGIASAGASLPSIQTREPEMANLRR